MTELEMIQRAKIYMEKLAMGINPLDDSPVPEEELINNVRISRCFTFTAQMLGRMAEKQSSPSKKRPALSLDFDARSKFDFSNEPIPVSHITKRLNDLLQDDRMLQFNYSDITGWLRELDLLYSKPDQDGKYSRYPTPQGEALGISVEMRTGAQGTYKTVLYNLDAQKFILDNLDAIINIRNIRAEKRKLPWSSDEDESLKRMYASGYPMIDITAMLRRTQPSVKNRMIALGLTSSAPDSDTRN